MMKFTNIYYFFFKFVTHIAAFKLRKRGGGVENKNGKNSDVPIRSSKRYSPFI